MNTGAIVLIIIIVLILIMVVMLTGVYMKYRKIHQQIMKEMEESSHRKKLRMKKKLEALKREAEKAEVTGEEIEQRLAFAQSLLVRNGAERTDFKGRYGETQEERHIYRYRDCFYCVGYKRFPNSDLPYMVLGCTGDPQNKAVEDVDTFGFDISDRELEKEIRYILEIENSPEE